MWWWVICAVKSLSYSLHNSNENELLLTSPKCNHSLCCSFLIGQFLILFVIDVSLNIFSITLTRQPTSLHNSCILYMKKYYIDYFVVLMSWEKKSIFNRFLLSKINLYIYQLHHHQQHIFFLLFIFPLNNNNNNNA